MEPHFSELLREADTSLARQHERLEVLGRKATTLVGLMTAAVPLVVGVGPATGWLYAAGAPLTVSVLAGLCVMVGYRLHFAPMPVRLLDFFYDEPAEAYFELLAAKIYAFEANSRRSQLLERAWRVHVVTFAAALVPFVVHLVRSL